MINITELVLSNCGLIRGISTDESGHQHYNIDMVQNIAILFMDYFRLHN